MNTCTDSQLIQLSQQAGQALLTSNATLATAESCTGGWLAKVITDIAGSSGWFAYGFVTYSNQSKQHLLGVPDTVLKQYGAVSEPVVKHMAQTALMAASATYAIAISGIAGPGGGSAEKPVGTVWFALARANDEPLTYCQQFAGDREAVRRQATEFALRTLCWQLAQNT